MAGISADGAQLEGEERIWAVNKASEFFIGIPYPSMAAKLDWGKFMLSFNRISDNRIAPIQIKKWMGDCGAFTLLERFGKFPTSEEEYAAKINKWANYGELVAAISRDWLCAPTVLAATGLSVAQHQQLTIEGYQRLRLLTPVYVMPTLQGHTLEDYVVHLENYGDLLTPGQWVGLGSLVGRPKDEVRAIAAATKALRPDLRLHGFGVEPGTAQGLFHSCDHMKWSHSNRKALPEIEAAGNYLKQVKRSTSDYRHYRKTRTSGAGNGQGRKAVWNSQTKTIRVPVAVKPTMEKLAKILDSDPSFVTHLERLVTESQK